MIERGTKSIDTMLYFLLFNIAPTAVELVAVGVIFYLNFGWELVAATALTVAAYITLTRKVTEWPGTKRPDRRPARRLCSTSSRTDRRGAGAASADGGGAGDGRSCGHCGRTDGAFSRCARCRGVVYCGIACQRADWKTHKKVCRRRAKPAATDAAQHAGGGGD